MDTVQNKNLKNPSTVSKLYDDTFSRENAFVAMVMRRTSTDLADMCLGYLENELIVSQLCQNLFRSVSRSLGVLKQERFTKTAAKGRRHGHGDLKFQFGRWQGHGGGWPSLGTTGETTYGTCTLSCLSVHLCLFPRFFH